MKARHEMTSRLPSQSSHSTPTHSSPHSPPHPFSQLQTPIVPHSIPVLASALMPFPPKTRSSSLRRRVSSDSLAAATAVGAGASSSAPRSATLRWLSKPGMSWSSYTLGPWHRTQAGTLEASYARFVDVGAGAAGAEAVDEAFLPPPLAAAMGMEAVVEGRGRAAGWKSSLWSLEAEE